MSLVIRVSGSDGTSALEYLNGHPTMAKEPFQPTEAYKDQMIQRLGTYLSYFEDPNLMARGLLRRRHGSNHWRKPMNFIF